MKNHLLLLFSFLFFITFQVNAFCEKESESSEFNKNGICSTNSASSFLIDLCDGTTLSTANGGVLNDSGGANGNYTNSENCTFLISPVCAQTVTLSFTAFNLESCCDALTVFDGSDINAPILFSGGGSVIPNDITSTGGTMFVTFTSDGSVTLSGWEATWTSSIPTAAPVANFSISNTNAPINSDIQFTDQSTNLPAMWLWDFGDGSSSILQNPTHQYSSPGTYEVTLTVDNCLSTDVTSQMLTIQEMPDISYSPSAINVAIDCGMDSIVSLDITNNGVGDASFLIDQALQNVTQTSEIIFDISGLTTHTFEDLFPNSASLDMQIILNGDYDSGFEAASLFIDGNLIEEIDDGNPNNGTDIIKDYSFDAATIAPWLADGILVVEIQNTAGVNLNQGGTNTHSVSITTNNLDWLFINPLAGVITPGGTNTIEFNINTAGLVSGIYDQVVSIHTNDPSSPLFELPVTLEVLGDAEITFPAPCLDFSNLMQFTSETFPLSISNPGCDTLEISSIQFDHPDFSADLSQLNILPFGIDTVMVTFAPQGVGNLNANMNFSTNVGMASVCLNGSSFDAPVFAIQPTVVDITLDCGQDSIISIDLVNSGLGELTFEGQNIGESFEDTSLLNIDFINSNTFHVFENLAQSINNFELTVIINGDYDNTAEFATLFIEGQLIEQIDDGNITNGTDIITTYSFDNTMIGSWFADGVLEVEIVNSSSVDQGQGALGLHTVILTSTGANWLEMMPSVGTVAPNSTQSISINLSAADLVAGNYSNIISFLTNDPINPVQSLPVNLTVVGPAIIEFGMPCVDFPSTLQFTSETLPLVVQNTGCDTLEISNITSGASEFSVNNSQMSIPPFSFDTLWVTFSPLTGDVFSSNLQFSSNSNPASVCLTGSSVEAPVISVNPTSFSFSMNSCSDSITLPLTVTNIGANNLIYEFLGATSNNGNGAELDSVRIRVNESFEEITNLLPDFFEFTNGVTGFSISDGGDDMYDSGNFIRVNNSNTNIPYSDDLIIPEAMLGAGGQYFTKKHPGLFLFAADIENVTDFSIIGGLGADGAGLVEGAILDHTYQGSNYRGFVKRVFNSSDPSVNHLIIVKNPNASASHNFSLNTNDDNHIVSGLNGVGRIYYLLFAGQNGTLYDDNVFMSVMEKFIDIVEAGSFATVPSGSFVLTDGASETLDLLFTTQNTPGGVYENVVLISSNDPQNPILQIPVTINVGFDLCANFIYEQPVICGGQINFTSTSINTPSSFLWDFGDGNTSTQINPTHIYSSPGIYEVQLTITNTTSSDMISYMVVIDETSAPQAACNVFGTNNFPTNEISTFTLNTIQNASGFIDENYSDYTCEFSTNLVTGVDYIVEIESVTFSTQDARIWIDLNNNGAFTSDELMFSSDDQNAPHIGTITIPPTATIGVPLRCRVLLDDSFNTSSPCIAASSGEFEDYTVFIESNTMPPVANFNFGIVDDCQGIIQFNDQSTNLPTSWFWEFGDGGTSGLQNPTHTYNSAGVYTVTLTSSNSIGSDMTTFNVTTNVLNPGIDILTGDLVLDQPIPFSANAPGGISWIWNFGDGGTSTSENPEHTYTSVGTYNVTLTVTNGIGCVNSTQVTISIIIDDLDELSPFVSIFPNPSGGDFLIQNTSGSNYKNLEIINSIGQVVYTNEVLENKEKYPLHLTHLPDGIYWLKLDFKEEGFLVKKISIHKN